MSAPSVETSFVPCCAECWHSPARPCPRFVEWLAAGPLCHQNAPCGTVRAARNAELRREVVTRPVIYIGTGTCGLGAGSRSRCTPPPTSL